ncbi:hypothetical protein RYZ26_06880 [Terasakiella sp. A23]|uniref:hypothetical protein n=1 Tax=Terasakiella sp. FCG-A23 TaxID=3080561 RepID=UPI0029557DA7|nr:hypothetical protein [Terasakiella sp. A23]MDV7339309.1 hypothetical protein [Terasakiella sp. A23]
MSNLLSFQEILPNTPPKRIENMIAGRIENLFKAIKRPGNLEEWQIKQLEEIEQTISSHDLPYEDDGNDWCALLRDKHKIYSQDYPYAHLLAWQPTCGATDLQKINLLKAYLFLAAVCWPKRDESPTTVPTVFGNLRNILKDEKRHILEVLPTNGSITKVISSLEHATTNWKKEHEGRTTALSFLNLLDKFHLEEDAILRSPFLYDEAPVETKVETEEVETDEDDYRAQLLSDVPVLPANSVKQENFRDGKVPSRNIRVQSKRRKKQYWGAKHTYLEGAISNGIVKNEIGAPCASNSMTNDEAEVLFRKICLAMRGTPIVGLLGLSLLTGRNAKEIHRSIVCGNSKEVDRWFIDGGQLVLKHRIAVSSHKLSEEAKSFVLPGGGFVFVRLPKLFQETYKVCRQHSGNDESWLDDIRSFLSEIGREMNANLTLVKIAAYPFNKIRWDGASETVAAAICGKSPTNFPQLYYLHFNSEVLETSFMPFVKELVSFSNDLGLGLQFKIESKEAGSKIYPSLKQVRKFVQRLKGRLKAAKTRIEYHNAFVLYLTISLLFSNGHRPVKGPCDLLDDNDFLRGFHWIADKENRSILSARIVPMPKVIRALFHDYLEHLANLKTSQKFSDDKRIAEYCQRAIDGQVPLLFFIDDRGRPQTVSPKWLTSKVKDIWPLPLNAGRHILVSFLHRKGVKGEIIDAVVGHSGFRQEPFGPWSGCSIKHLQGASVPTEKYIEWLGISTVEKWEG